MDSNEKSIDYGMIKLTNFSIGYDADQMLIETCDAEFFGGSVTALIGRNGAGKSTLLRAIAGLNRSYSGEVAIKGSPIANLEPIEIAKSVAFVGTSRPRVANLTCREVVATGRAPYTDWIGRLGAVDREIVESAIHTIGLDRYANRPINSLSDGECQRVMIARAMAQSASVILLDEPTSYLDMPSRYELVLLLRRLAHDEGKCILFSTHELDVAMQLCDNVALVAEKTIVNKPAHEMALDARFSQMFAVAGLKFNPTTGSFNIVND